MGSIKELLEYLLNAVKIWIIVQPWQTALIVRNGTKIKEVPSGIYFRLPYFDSVFIQENRLRVNSMAIQTLTTKDLKTISLNGSIGYSVSSIKKLYKTLYHPESTIANMAMSEIAAFVFDRNLEEITPKIIEEAVFFKLKNEDFGLHFEYFRISNFAVVKTFRLIQDQSWLHEGLSMSKKK